MNLEKSNTYGFFIPKMLSLHTGHASASTQDTAPDPHRTEKNRGQKE